MFDYSGNCTVWITGASSGLGRFTAEAFKQAGYRVISGARSFKEPEEDTPSGIRRHLDVTDPDSVADFVREAQAAAGAPDILICCAGILNLGACEYYTADEMKKVLDTNFLGQVRMIQAVLPLMRARGHGRIVCFSSINGVLGIPYQGIYTASKHALEGFCESLAAEVRPFGIEILLVEPGDHRGGSDAYRAHGEGMNGNNPYIKPYQRTVESIRHDEEHGSDPKKLGQKLVRTVGKRRLPLRRCIASPLQHAAVFLHRVMISAHFNRLIALFYSAHKID